MSSSRLEPVLMMPNGSLDNWRRRIAMQKFILAALLIPLAEIILLFLALDRSQSATQLMGWAVGLPILTLVVAFIEVKWTQARTLDVLTNYEYHWMYRPDELESFAQLVRRENGKRTFGRGVKILPHPEVRRGIADEIFISRTHLYEIGGYVMSLKVPVSQFAPVFGDQLTTLQHKYEYYFRASGEEWKGIGEMWILVPDSEAGQFKPNAE